MNLSIASPGGAGARAALTDRRLTACLLAAGGLLGVSVQAHAGGILSSGPLSVGVTFDPDSDLSPPDVNFYISPTLIPPEGLGEVPGGTFPMFELGDGAFSFGWAYNYVDSSLVSGSLLGGSIGGLVADPTSPPGFFVKPFESGDTIDGTDMKINDQGKALVLLSAYDSEEGGLAPLPWLGQDIFIGIGVPVGDNLHNGWFEVNVPATFAVGSTVTVLGWAYCEDPNASIQAGQTEGACAAGVPEPSVPSLLLLGLGAAGVAGWRRRRAAERAEFRKQACLAEAA